MRGMIFLWMLGYAIHPDRANEILDSERMQMELTMKDPKGLMDEVERQLNFQNSQELEARTALGTVMEQLLFMTMLNGK
jgi:hypothetical protein